MAARRRRDGSAERGPLRAWLRRLAAGRLAAGRQEIPFPEPIAATDTPWLEPYPVDFTGDPASIAEGLNVRHDARESMSLVFVAALQHLPPHQRAALVLCDVHGFRAAEAAEILDCDTETLDGTLQRARAEIAARLPSGWHDRSPLPGSARELEVTGRFADAFERGDVDGLVALLTDDAWLASPPLPGGYRGRAAAEILSEAPFRDAPRRFRLIATRANGQPAFGCYLSDPVSPIAHAHGLIVLTLDGDRVSGITRFTDNSLLPLFGLPRTLPD